MIIETKAFDFRHQMSRSMMRIGASDYQEYLKSRSIFRLIYIAMKSLRRAVPRILTLGLYSLPSRDFSLLQFHISALWPQGHLFSLALI